MALLSISVAMFHVPSSMEVEPAGYKLFHLRIPPSQNLMLNIECEVILMAT